MPKLRKITPLDRHIDIMEQTIKRLELELQELYSLRPRVRKKKEPEYKVVTNRKGKKFNFRVG